MTATKEDLAPGEGPVVVVPPRLLVQAGRSASYHHGFAASIDAARQELNALNLEDEVSGRNTTLSSSPLTTTPGSPRSPAENPSADSFAFAFDIDGVLIRGGRPIPEAIEAMKILNGENEYGIRV